LSPSLAPPFFYHITLGTNSSFAKEKYGHKLKFEFEFEHFCYRTSFDIESKHNKRCSLSLGLAPLFWNQAQAVPPIPLLLNYS